MSAGCIAVPNVIPLQPPSTDGTLRNCLAPATKIELKSDTPKTDVYFTLDGSKPEPFAPLGFGKSTIKYDKPFSLPQNQIRVTIKAVAVTFDGMRESNMVTRTYQIKQYGDENNNETSLLQGSVEALSQITHHNSVSKFKKKFAPKSNSGSKSSLIGSLPGSVPLSSGKNAVNPLLVAALICTNCCAPRSRYGKSKYCSECGTIYPDMKGKPASGARRRGNKNTNPLRSGTMGICVNCKSYVPLNSSTCLVCDTELKTQLPGKTTGAVKLECSSCMTKNPATATSCMVCENSLVSAKQLTGPQAMAPPIELSTNVSPNKKKCAGCRTLNPSDTAFCGSCGKKQENHLASECPQCRSQVPKGSKFCLGCGALCLQDSAPSKTESFSINIAKADATDAEHDPNHTFVETIVTNHASLSKPQVIVPSASGPLPTLKPTPSEHVVTVKRNLPLFSTPAPVINPIVSQKSPGGGFWRKQLDHIASHLKLYANSHKDFQHDVAEVQIGKMIGATVDLSESEGLFRLCLDFALIEEEEREVSQRPVHSRFMESAKARSEASRRSRRDNFESENPVSFVFRTPNRKKRATSAVSQQKSDPSNERRTRSTTPGGRSRKLKPESEDLLKEIQMDKDLDDVQKLLDSGADPNVRDREGVPVLVLAVRQYFQEAIDPLVQAGADANVQFGVKNNSPLHEAALLGPAGKQTVLSLLKNEANPELENKQGETAQALAIKHGYSELADIIAAHLSHKLLNT